MPRGGEATRGSEMTDSRRGNGDGRGDRERNDRDRQDREPERNRDERRPAPRGNEAKSMPWEVYLTQISFDSSRGRYVGQVVELPEIRVEERTRQAAWEALEALLEDHVEVMRARGEPLPEPLTGKRYPDTLEVPLSQSLYRKLDALSKRERVSLDQIATELIAAAIEGRNSSQRAQPPAKGGNEGRQQGGGGGGRGRRPEGGGGQRGGGRYDYHQTMSSRENFLEYVRNLEKRGGRK